MNIGSRTSFDNMWFRQGKPGKDWADTAANTMIANIAAPSMGEGIIKGVQDIAEGNVERGVEGLVPAFFRGPLTAYRLGTEGAETRGGDKVMETGDIGLPGLIGQALGFQPTELAQRQQRASAAANDWKGIQQEQQSLLKQFNTFTAMPEKADTEKAQKVLQKIAEFNNRYPIAPLQITTDTLAKSQRSFINKHAMTYEGLAMTK